MGRLAASLLAVTGVLALAGCGSSSGKHSTVSTAVTAAAPQGPGTGKPAVTLATKNFTEQFILGELYSQALRAKGYTVKLQSNVGSSEVVNKKLVRGEIDGYPEYTGTILSALAHQTTRAKTAQQAYLQAAAFEHQRGSALLAMAPAQDTDVLAVKPAYATRNHLRSITDLKRIRGSVNIAAAPEFRTRFNGLIGLRLLYGLTNIVVHPVTIGTQYAALDQRRVQLAAVFTTDGNLVQGGYTLLGDPRNVFGFQNVTFVIKRPVLAREGPEFQRTINSVSAKLSTQALRVMNAAVELDQQSPSTVARQFLAANGLA